MKYKSWHGGSHAMAWAAIITSVFQVFPTTFKTRRGIAAPRFSYKKALMAAGGQILNKNYEKDSVYYGFAGNFGFSVCAERCY